MLKVRKLPPPFPRVLDVMDKLPKKLLLIYKSHTIINKL